VSISKRIRHRLVTVILLGVITSALSLVALLRVISLSVGSRVERGRVSVLGEIVRLSEATRPEIVDSPSRSGLVGLRGGFAVDGDIAQLTVPPDWRLPIQQTLAAARGAVSTPKPSPIVTETALPGGTLLVAAQPAATSRSVVWAAYLVPPPVWLRTWQIIVIALALATALLVTTAIAAVITVKRGAAELTAALDGLATDLNTPVPRPRLRELSDVADGIARLAHRLTRARDVQNDMARELALKDRLAALGRVVAGVAHEVRNPLASIKLRLDLAAGGGPALPPAVAEAIVHASGEITRLDRLVADLLVVASPGIGPRQSIALGPLVQARVDSLAPWCDVRGIAIRVAGDASAAVDVDAIARAVDNLVRNAVEASPPGATVEVSVRQGEATASIAVEDRGAGVPAARTQELFEPFFTTKPEGTGLGLAICRSIARAHGGDVTFARKRDATCVELTLARTPWSPAEASLAAGARPA
jgi:signal transduction histidine kinase